MTEAMATFPILLRLINKLCPLQEAYLSQGSELRLVGGCVRDALLGKLATDIDLATPMLPHEGMALLTKRGITCIPTGIKHGTFTALIDHQTYEITTLRRDIATDGRWAKVDFSSDWQADAMRRDLTINALYADFSGRIYDYFDGIEDLKQGIIRFVGDAQTRITEDYLRLLRLFRFHAWYGKHPIDNQTLKVCEHLAPKLLTLSKERITKEFLKLLEAPFPLPSLRQMACHGVLAPLFNNYHLMNMAALLPLEQRFKMSPHPFRRLAALTDDHHIFRFSKAQEGYLKKTSTLSNQLLFEETHYRFHLSFENKEMIQDAILIKYVKEQYDNLVLLTTIMDDINTLEIPLFPITGADLLPFGINGPQLGEMLARCRWWWTKNKFQPDKTACLAWIQQELQLQNFNHRL